MKLLSTGLAMSMVLASATAFADEPIKLRLSVEPVTDQAELHELMRQNTVRVALQRYRLWQQAAAGEQARAEAQVGEETPAGEPSADKLERREADEAATTAPRKRTRVKSRTAKRRAGEARRAATEQASKADRETVDEPATTRERERKQRGTATADNSTRQSTASQQREALRNILRAQRLGNENLDDKLQTRTRAEERHQGQKQGQGQGQGQGKHKGQGGGGGRGGGR